MPLPMENNPKILALRDALSQASSTLATSAFTATDEALRDTVCLAVDELRALSWPPERVIIAIKQVAEDAGLTQSHRVLLKNRALDARDGLVARVIRWTVECYYDTSRVA